MQKNERMKKDASKLMTEERFWNLIARSDNGNTLKQTLTPLTENELFGFRYWWE